MIRAESGGGHSVPGTQAADDGDSDAGPGLTGSSVAASLSLSHGTACWPRALRLWRPGPGPGGLPGSSWTPTEYDIRVSRVTAPTESADSVVTVISATAVPPAGRSLSSSTPSHGGPVIMIPGRARAGVSKRPGRRRGRDLQVTTEFGSAIIAGMIAAATHRASWHSSQLKFTGI